MTFVGRLVLVMAVAVVTTVAVIAALVFLASQKVSAEIEEARASYLVGALRATAEATLSIGLSLEQAGQLQVRIEREKANDPALLAIDIYNTGGRLLYSTDRASVGDTVPAAWIEGLRGEGTFEVAGPRETVFGTRFENDLGLAGGIALTVSDAARRARVETLGVDLAWRATLVAALALALAVAAAWGFAHVMTRPFARVTRVLKGEDVAVRHGEELEQQAVRVRAHWVAAERRIAQGMDQLKALDDAT